MDNDSCSSDELNDIADFTLTSINQPVIRNEEIDIEQNQTHSPTRLSRAKSTSSFIISPHRKSSIIIASTGKRIQRSYSTWNQLTSPPDIRTNENTQTNQASNNTVSKLNELLLILYNYLKSLITRPIIKASITYFFTSLAVYSPTISDFLGTSDSKHMVCTVVVYFHASRSVGSMIQALMFVSFALLFGIGVSVTTLFSISTYLETFQSLPGLFLVKNADITSPIIIFLTLIICSTSLGLISFCKHRVKKQTFNTACSLAAILMISCLIKEYSKILDSPTSAPGIPWDKIKSSISCVICGCIISVTVCFTLWRKWAQKKLKKQIHVVQKSIGDTLALLCDLFTSNDWTVKKIEEDRLLTSKSFKDLKSKLSQLDAPLEETMFECLVFGKEQEFLLFKSLVNSQKKLVAYLGGLRRAVEFKWEMIEYYRKLREKKKKNNDDEIVNENETISNSESQLDEYNSNINQSKENDLISTFDIELDPSLVEKPEELIEMFLYHLGPSIKSFVFTMKEILDGNLYEDNNKINNIVIQYSKSLSSARDLFESHQKKAIDSLYKQDIFTKSWGFDDKINQEEVAATCANYSFSVTQVSTELETYLSHVNSLLDYTQNPIKSFNFLKLWKNETDIPIYDIERNQLLNINSEQLEAETIGYKIWKFTKFTRGVDFQFGFRVGLGAFILGTLAFLDSTRHIFNEWRGEWILVTYCIIMNKSLGGTSMTIKWRFLGTFLGAFTAYHVWIFFYPNVFLMAISGFFVSIPCFDIILNWKANNAFGRFILLTYNLTVLYSYTMSLNSIPNGDDWEGGDNPIIFEIAFHRYIGVSLGVIWALVITLTLFPVTARSRIKRGLSVLWLRMGVVWKRGALYKRKDEYGEFRLDGLRGLRECHFIMEELRILLKQAPVEMRLKGSFPTEIYTKLMDGTEGILDAYENMNSIVDVDTLLSPIELLVIDNLKTELKELQNRVFLIFYMLASAMKLGLPLASDPATTEHAMVKLMCKLGDVRRTVEARKELGKTAGLKNTNFVLFYTYCLVTNSIVNELSKLMKEVSNLYGKLDEETLELT